MMYTQNSTFSHRVRDFHQEPFRALELTTLQLNLGKRCNLSCTHCHLQAGPHRTEMMSKETALACLAAAKAHPFTTLDLTGGAPELNPHLPLLLTEGKKLGKSLIMRTNLTALALPQSQQLFSLLLENQVGLVASLPCYTQENTDSQRGKGTFQQAIAILQRLNRLGYGTNPQLQLDLVYNPGGAFLPPPQKALEADYKQQLKQAWGIVFHKLLALTNLPLGGFKKQLEGENSLASYEETLRNAFNPATLPQLMCRHQLSVDWQGDIYDCDFNQCLGLPCRSSIKNIRQFSHDPLATRKIALANHCYGCTAGAGSSCGGALA